MVESRKAYREAAGVFDYVCKIGHYWLVIYQEVSGVNFSRLLLFEAHLFSWRTGQFSHFAYSRLWLKAITNIVSFGYNQIFLWLLHEQTSIFSHTDVDKYL